MNYCFLFEDITDIESDVEAIRLVNGDNVNQGRLELLYNGTWGTVCDNFWSYSNSKVACRYHNTFHY